VAIPLAVLSALQDAPNGLSVQPYKEEVCIMRKRGVIMVLCLLIAIPMLFCGCAGMTAAQKGAVGGAGLGGVAGGLIGGSTKATLIGMGAGALGGALLNDAIEKDKKK
jgi:osmotically inducible lipoprotein OsmB